MNILNFGNMEFKPKEIVADLPVSRDPNRELVEIKPKFRHACSQEQYDKMLADTTDTRPIKIFFPMKDSDMNTKVNMHEGSTNVGVFEAAGKVYVSMLFFRVDDRVEIFNEDEESIGLIYTSDSAVLFNGKQIGRVRYPYSTDEKQTMKMELYKEGEKDEIIDSGISKNDVEAFLKAECIFTKHLIENNIITVPAVTA